MYPKATPHLSQTLGVNPEHFFIGPLPNFVLTNYFRRHMLSRSFALFGLNLVLHYLLFIIFLKNLICDQVEDMKLIKLRCWKLKKIKIIDWDQCTTEYKNSVRIVMGIFMEVFNTLGMYWLIGWFKEVCWGLQDHCTPTCIPSSFDFITCFSFVQPCIPTAAGLQ